MMILIHNWEGFFKHHCIIISLNYLKRNLIRPQEEWERVFVYRDASVPGASLISLDSGPADRSLRNHRKEILEGRPGRAASQSCVCRHPAGRSLCQWVSLPGNPGRGGRRGRALPLLKKSVRGHGSAMFYRLQRLTPGYIRLLQVRTSV